MSDDYDDLPHTHPAAERLHQVETDLTRLAATSMHPANVQGIVVAEWFTAALDPGLPGNVRDYCADIAVMRARVRDMQRKHRAQEETNIAAEMIARDVAEHQMPNDASELTNNE